MRSTEYCSISMVTHGITIATYLKLCLYMLPPPQDFEILGWCPAGSVLPHGEKVPLYPWLATLLVMVSQQKCLKG